MKLIKNWTKGWRYASVWVAGGTAVVGLLKGDLWVVGAMALLLVVRFVDFLPEPRE